MAKFTQRHTHTHTHIQPCAADYIGLTSIIQRIYTRIFARDDYGQPQWVNIFALGARQIGRDFQVPDLVTHTHTRVATYF